MALNKAVTVNGVQINYWKISSLNISYTGELTQIYIMGFLDKVTRDKGLENSFVLQNYYCKKDMFSKYFGTEENLHVGNFANTLQASYSFLKDNVEEFKDALDC